jgi:hypothetical protein
VGTGPSYIALRVKHVPLDQTDLKDGVDAILGGGGRSFWRMTAKWDPGGPGGM